MIACEMLERAESGKWENDFLQSDTKTRTRMCVWGVCGVCVCVCVCVLIAQSSPPGDLPDPGIKPTSLLSPTLVSGFFTTGST